MSLGVAVFVTKDSEFRKMRVGNLESLNLCVRHNAVNGNIRYIFALMEYNSVSVGEGASFDVLAGDSDVVTLLEQSSESESLGCSPVNSLTLRDGFLSGFVDLLDLRVEFPVIRESSDFLSDVFQNVQVDTSVLEFAVLFALLDGLPFFVLPFLESELMSLALFVGLVQLSLDVFLHLVYFLLRHNAFFEQLLLV